MTPLRAGLFVFLVWSTHVLIDVFTVYGTQVFDPFHGYRASFDNLFIIDFFFTIPLLVAVAILAGLAMLSALFIFFPLYYRFGDRSFGYSALVLLAPFLGLVVRKGIPGTFQTLETFLTFALDSVPFLAASITGVAALGAISCAASIRLYRRREF